MALKKVASEENGLMHNSDSEKKYSSFFGGPFLQPGFQMLCLLGNVENFSAN